MQCSVVDWTTEADRRTRGAYDVMLWNPCSETRIFGLARGETHGNMYTGGEGGGVNAGGRNAIYKSPAARESAACAPYGPLACERATDPQRGHVPLLTCERVVDPVWATGA